MSLVAWLLQPPPRCRLVGGYLFPDVITSGLTVPPKWRQPVVRPGHFGEGLDEAAGPSPLAADVAALM